MAEIVARVAAMKMLASTEPPLFLSPSQQLAGIARTASAEIFSSLVPDCPKPPLDRLLVDAGFDAEQIWQQIELLSSPLLSSLRRELKRLQREPPSMLSVPPKDEEDDHEDMQVEDGALDTYKNDDDDEDEGKASEERDEGEEEEEEEDAEDESEEVKDGGVEDRFLKIKELEEYLDKDEAREYGAPKKKVRKSAFKDDDSDNSEDEDDEDEDQGDFNFEDLEADDDDDEGEEEANDAEDARYDAFFGSKKKRGGQKVGVDAKKRRSSKKVDVVDDSDDMGMDSEQGDDIDDDDDDDADDKTKDNQFLSIHEKQLQNIQAKIEQMEKENLETKSWTMQGEITASRRPKNSALEVNLDFDHKARPPPVITDEITTSLEDLIRRRIIEGHFDDVQRAPALPLKAPRELKELDEKKSQKGLAEIYEEEYAQKTGLAPVPLSSSDEQKQEASILFKRLCLKLDALSHFHFAPKPVIEDMSVQVNVPALAMEEIAPLAVSDSAMLAPEEVFQGKGDIKEAAELTQAERKRKRANKKRKFKVEKAGRAAKKPRELSTVNKSTGSKDL